MRILIVDDSVTTRLLLGSILTKFGQCTEAENGAEAVEIFKEAFLSDRPFDLMFLDVMMPKMDGHQALEQIRDWEASLGVWGDRGIKVIMATALDEPDSMLKAYSEDCESYLVKPITKQKIINALKELKIIF